MTTKTQKIALILALCLLTFTLKSQSLLWIIEGNGLQKPSYLFGTVHTVCKKDFKWDEKLDNVCAYTKRVYFEVDFLSIAEVLRYQKVSKIKDNDYSLKKLYSESDYTLIQNYFKDYLKTKIENFDNRSPLFLIINSSRASFKKICKRTKSYEEELAKRYPNPLIYVPNKIHGLETAIEREKILNQIPFERQAEILLSEVKSSYETTYSEENEYKNLVKEYFEMNVENIYKSSIEKAKYPDLEKVLLSDRNQLWVEKIPTIAMEKSTLFAVGSAHLGGEKGLINLLKQKGFIIRPLSLNMKEL